MDGYRQACTCDREIWIGPTLRTRTRTKNRSNTRSRETAVTRPRVESRINPSLSATRNSFPGFMVEPGTFSFTLGTLLLLLWSSPVSSSWWSPVSSVESLGIPSLRPACSMSPQWSHRLQGKWYRRVGVGSQTQSDICSSRIRRHSHRECEGLALV